MNQQDNFPVKDLAAWGEWEHVPIFLMNNCMFLFNVLNFMLALVMLREGEAR